MRKLEAIINDKSIAKHSKSFHFASKIFDSHTAKKVSLLYALCRYIDDCADSEDSETGKPKLLAVRATLEGKQEAGELSDILMELISLGVEKENILALTKGALFDVDGRQIENESDLVQYCYLVAGTVGLMMCNLFAVKGDRAQRHAVALGIAMQLTNICRDVLEDARAGRSYLPLSTLRQHDLSLEVLSRKGETPKKLKKIVESLLIMSERYYEMAYEGLAYLPLRIRLSILVAGEVYRSIGRKIASDDFAVLSGRTTLSTGEKVLVAIKTLPRILRPSFWRVPDAKNALGPGITSLIETTSEDLYR